MVEESSGSYRHILKYTGIFGGVQGLNIVISLVRTKLVALLLGPSGMGLASLFNTTVGFISQATNFGLPISAVKHLSALVEQGDDAGVRHYIKIIRWWGLMTALLGMAVCVMAGPFLSHHTFAWGDHTLHFILLAPAVGLAAITGGETAILKSARRLQQLAVVQVYAIFSTLVIAVPAYYFWGQAAIVPVIVLQALVSMLLTIRYSYKLYPLQLSRAGNSLNEGFVMIRLGVAFVVAGVLGSGAEMLIRSYLNLQGDLDAVGLYNAGYMLTITYAGIVFSSMEADYFPRLSAVQHDVKVMNETVNRQMEVSLLLASPMLATLIIALPVLIPLLFSGQFLPVVGMAQVAVFSMYMKAVSLPISYLTLAKGDSVAYMLLEGLYDVVVVGLIVVGYQYGGLTGTGVALSLSYLLDLVVVGVYASVRYHYQMSSQVARYIAVQLLPGVAAYLTSRLEDSLLYWLLGGLCCLFSLLFSLFILHRHA